MKLVYNGFFKLLFLILVKNMFNSLCIIFFFWIVMGNDKLIWFLCFKLLVSILIIMGLLIFNAFFYKKQKYFLELKLYFDIFVLLYFLCLYFNNIEIVCVLFWVIVIIKGFFIWKINVFIFVFLFSRNVNILVLLN